MTSSLKGKQDEQLRRISAEAGVVLPENAPENDESPTVISKTSPLTAPSSAHVQKNQFVDLARRAISPESLVASLRGRRLAHYELIEPIGVGGMAAVIRARDTQLDRFVALKILPPEMAQEIENVHRFHQEAKAAAKLDHENIARVFFCGEDQGLHFIAFEFVEGINLRTMLEQRGSLPVAEAIRYVLQVAAGLEHAATRGVVHRDVKPSNIIISPNGRAKLVDMGLARNLERHGERDLTQSGVTLGTFDYISPEQALEPREADSRSDIYSLGCTLYHMLTGQTSVPEGTPAKKLHHHQHVAPLDPRQSHPEIPAEVVQVLGKMMAKNPKDRYQRPIHLVHHLMQVAQKVCPADDIPEGVLFLDAPLPERPRSRPLLVIGLALAALVVVVLLLSLVPDPAAVTPEPPTPKKNYSAAIPSTSIQDSGHAALKPEPNPAANRITTIKNAKDLQTVLDDRLTYEVKATIDGKIALKDGLLYHGGKDQTLELESDDPNGYAILSFGYESDGATAGLIVDGGKEVIFRRIKFQIGSATTPTTSVAAVLVRGAKKMRFDHCIFVQTDVPPISPQRVPLASLLIDALLGRESSRPVVVLEECFFDSNNQAGGQAAIALNGPVMMKATNCAFRPHGAFFQFRKECTQAQTDVQLQNCAGFVVRGPAFRFDAGASARVSASQSVFSRPDESLVRQEGLPQADLIFLADRTPMQYAGKGNLYHNLNALIEQNKGGILTKADEFQKYLEQSGGSDQDSLYLNQPEPSASPLQHPLPLDRFDDLAFQLKYEYFKNFGLKESWLRKMPDPPGAPLVAKTLPAVAPKVKIVDAEDGGKTPGVLSNVNQALVGALDGDTILIKHGDSREVSVQPIAIKPGVNVTLKPYDGYQPILVLDKDFRDKDICFFHVRKGSLRLEQLEIVLDPGQTGFEAQSIVQLGESAQCSFKQCVLTLRNTSKSLLHVATFLDTDRMMKMETPASSQVRVEFDRCFVRGRGDLVNLRGCRSLQVEVKQSLIALAGPLLDIQSTNKVMAMEQGVHWNMDRSSVFTTESLFTLHSATGKGLTKTMADRIEGCLLVALAADQPVVALEMAKDDDLKTYLEWKGEKNFYAKFEKLRDWKEQYPDPTAKSVYDRLTFPKLDEEAVQNLWDATPEWFRPLETDQERLSGFGVPAEVEPHLLPAPVKANGL